MKMYNQPQNRLNEIEIDKSDLVLFKNISLVFILTRIGDIVSNIILDTNVIGMIINQAGFLIFALGIYSLSQKKDELKSGSTVAFLFILTLVVNIVYYVFDSSLETSEIEPRTIQELIEYVGPMVESGMTIVFLLVLSALLTIISAKYFTDWFNSAFSDFYNETKAFYYYGIILAVGQFLLAFGMFTIIGTFRNIINRSNVSYNDTGPLESGLLMMGLAALLFIVATIVEIVASVKIYNRVNDRIIGRNQTIGAYLPPNQTGYQQPFRSTDQRPIRSYQQVEQQLLELNRSRNQSSTELKTNKLKYCTDCGMKKLESSRFCPNCGFQF